MANNRRGQGLRDSRTHTDWDDMVTILQDGRFSLLIQNAVDDDDDVRTDSVPIVAV